MASANSRWAVALYPYTGSEELRTLSLSDGDLLEVYPREGKDWWPAELKGNRGFVPRTYIKLFEVGWDPEKQGGELASRIKTQTTTTTSTSSRSSTKAASQRKKRSKLVPAVAKYTFEKQEKGQLGFTKGEALRVRPTEHDWWPAISSQGKGLVPKNYIRLIEAVPEGNGSITEKTNAQGGAQTPTSRSSTKHKSGKESNHKSGKKKENRRRSSASKRTSKAVRPASKQEEVGKPETESKESKERNRLLVVAQYDFTRTSSCELSFNQGDFLEVERRNEEWWPARNAGGNTGLIPSNYVKVLGAASGNLVTSSAGSLGGGSTESEITQKGLVLQKTGQFLPEQAGTSRRWQMLTGNVGLPSSSFLIGYSDLADLPFFKVVLNELQHDPTSFRNTIQEFQKHLYFLSFTDGQVVVSEGVYNYNLYIILSGSLNVLHGTTDLCTLRPKDWLGETSLLSNRPFPVTVTSAGSSTVLALSADAFKLMVQSAPHVLQPFKDLVYARSLECLRTVPFFSVFSDEGLEILGSMVTFEHVSAKQRIYKQGEQARSFRIVLSGKVALTVASEVAGNSNMLIKHVVDGGFFGEAALGKSSIRNETATATTDALVMTVSGVKFARFLALDERSHQLFASVLEYRSGKSLADIPMLHAVPKEKLEPLASMMEYRLFQAGDCVYESGDVGSTFYIVVSGEMEASAANGHVLRVYQQGGYFGESALVEEAVRGDTVRCTRGPSICIVLQLESFRTFLTANPEVRALLLDSVINRGMDARVRRRAANTQPSELAGIHDLPSSMFETPECAKAMQVWRNVGMAMAPCLRILQGWPQYLHPPEYQLSKKNKKKFFVTVVGISQEIKATKIQASLLSTVTEVVEHTFRNFQQRMNGELLDVDGPSVFALKVAGRADYLLYRDMPLGFYKHITRCLRRGMDKGEIELALVDLRCDPKCSTGLRSAAESAPTGNAEPPVEDEYEYGVRHYAIALYDYEHSELCFHKGDKLQVEPHQDEWWPAVFKGVVGMIPMHYVNVLGPVGESSEPLKHRYSLKRQMSDSSRPAPSLPGVPAMTPPEWAETVRQCTAAAVEVKDSFGGDQGREAGAMSAHELMWPFRIQLRGIQKLRSLHRLLKFEYVSVRVDLVCGGDVLETKMTQPMKRKSVIRLDDEWYYFNRLVGHLHASARLCFTVVGMNKKGGRANTAEGSGLPFDLDQTSIMLGGALPGEALKLDTDRTLGGGSFQVYTEEYVLKMGTQSVRLWPDIQGERCFYCENNPAPNAPELVVQLDTYASAVYFPLGREVHVKRASQRSRRGSELSTSFRDTERPDTGNPNVEAILRLDPIRSYHITDTEKRFLWQERQKLVHRPDALPKFLFAVDWTSPEQREHALKLLTEWTPPGPMQAMELLDRRHVDIRVREYAVRCLEAFDDDELCEFLLQLVQVLKYEPFHESSLARFLLRRALQNPREIGMKLFWALRAEMHKLRFATRFGLMLQVYLQSCGRHREELTQQYDVQELLKGVSAKMMAQKISNKQERSAYCRLELEQVNQKLPKSFYLSIDPRLAVKRLVTSKCKVMNSKKKPLWLVMENTDPENVGGSNVSVMFKVGDDLRQDQMTLQLLRVMEQMWLEEGLDLRLTPYQCVSTGDELGMLELITKADTTAKIQTKYGGRMGALSEKTIRIFLEEHNKANFATAMDHFVHSCAGYAVATFVLGIGDRHSDNIMVKESGHLFHIDFGHFLGNFKSKYGVKRERTAFVFTKEMAYVMGGKGEKPFLAFVELCCKAFNILRRHGNDLINLFRLMIPAGMPELESDLDIDYLCTMLHLDKSDDEAAEIFKREIFTSLNDTYRRVDNLIHNLKQG